MRAVDLNLVLADTLIIVYGVCDFVHHHVIDFYVNDVISIFDGNSPDSHRPGIERIRGDVEIEWIDLSRDNPEPTSGLRITFAEARASLLRHRMHAKARHGHQ